jgi:hypothetical protein
MRKKCTVTIVKKLSRLQKIQPLQAAQIQEFLPIRLLYETYYLKKNDEPAGSLPKSRAIS